MPHKFKMFLLHLLGYFTFANSHGTLFYAGDIPSSDTKGIVRDIELIDRQIDSLRNPIFSTSLCRNAAPKAPISVRLSSNEDFTVTIAFSIGAQHIGPCSIEILDADNLSKPGIEIASAPSESGCAVPPIAQFNTDKASPASRQCPGKVPAGLVTDVYLF